MKYRIKQIVVLFLALTVSLFLLDAYAGKPVKVTVTAAVPDTAVQGDMTEVEIDGTGFDAGSTVRFIVTDTRDDTQIDVNEVTFDAVTGKLKATNFSCIPFVLNIKSEGSKKPKTAKPKTAKPKTATPTSLWISYKPSGCFALLLLNPAI